MKSCHHISIHGNCSTSLDICALFSLSDTYYSLTTGVLQAQLLKWLSAATTISEAACVWQRWTSIWSQFPLDGFLQSSIDAVLTKVPIARDGLDVRLLSRLLPWPKAAIDAYSVFTYVEQLDQSVVEYMRDQLGGWWTRSMHTIQGGMSQLPEAFAKLNEHGWNKSVHIYENIHFNRTVNEVVYTAHDRDLNSNHVVVRGYYSTSGQPFEVEGDAVIVCTPINILRQIDFKNPTAKDPQPPLKFYKAIEDIWCAPSTKIMIQSRTRFWETKDHIQGGFTKTNLPIGQIHYPSNPDGRSIPGDKGILLVYTWKAEALLFGSLNPFVAVRQAVRQIATIHPEIKDEFEVGAIESWYNNPSAQGAYTLLKPNQFSNVEWLMLPMENVYFAGDGISFASGWIQGALESGLRAAYQFFARNEKLVVP